MDVTINIFGIGGIVVLAIVIGYLIGRGEHKTLRQEEGAAETIGTQGRAQEGDVHPSDRRRKNEGRRIVLGKSIASPVAGEVSFFCEGGRKGAVIEPEQGMVYAPVSGKITKLYPMGNAFLLRSDERDNPMELLIRVGRQQPDELCSMYYKPCIVQNEIVNKGKLLLMFDKERLQAEGEDVSVLVCLEDGIYEREIEVTRQEKVKIGEEILKTY